MPLLCFHVLGLKQDLASPLKNIIIILGTKIEITRLFLGTEMPTQLTPQTQRGPTRTVNVSDEYHANKQKCYPPWNTNPGSGTLNCPNPSFQLDPNGSNVVGGVEVQRACSICKHERERALPQMEARWDYFGASSRERGVPVRTRALFQQSLATQRMGTVW